MLHFGEQLKTVRQARGYSLEYVEEQSNIHMAWLAALEEGRFIQFPDEMTALRAVLRYAAVLGMSVRDAEEDFVRHMHSLRSAPLSEKPEIQYREPQPETRPSFKSFIPGGIPLLNIAAAGVFLIAAIWLGSSFVAPFLAGQISGYGQQSPVLTEAQNNEERLESLKQAQPSRGEDPLTALGAVHGPGAASPAASENGLVLDLYARQECWIKLTVDGQVDFEGILPQGQSRKVKAEDAIKLKTSNAGSLGVTFNGQALKAIGDANEVVEKEFR